MVIGKIMRTNKIAVRERKEKSLPPQGIKGQWKAEQEEGQFLWRMKRMKIERTPKESSLVDECAEQLVMKLDHLLRIIDGVYPTTEWHVGT